MGENPRLSGERARQVLCEYADAVDGECHPVRMNSRRHMILPARPEVRPPAEAVQLTVDVATAFMEHVRSAVSTQAYGEVILRGSFKSDQQPRGRVSFEIIRQLNIGGQTPTAWGTQRR